MKVIVAGTGPGALELYTEQVREAVKTADLVLTAQRLEKSLSGMTDQVRVMGVADTVSYINANADREETVCVAASGDTGFYSIAFTIAKGVDSSVELSFLCGISSLSYFLSKLNMGYENVKLCSLHGRESSIVPHVCYNERVFTLSGGSVKAHHIAQQLYQAGLADVVLSVGENLSLPDERIVKGTAAEIKEMTFEDLSVVVIENEHWVNRHQTLKDGDFIRGKSPMTKEAVRNLCLSALEIMPRDVVYDIGAGTGSVTCAMAFRACESLVYAVEKEADAVRLIQANMEKTGAKNIVVKQALAPAGLEELPPADKVFIGGSTGNLKEIVEAVLQKNRKTVFVITAVTLETVSQAMEVLRHLHMNAEITCANISTAQRLGAYHLMKAENPVYIMKGTLHEQQDQTS